MSPYLHGTKPEEQQRLAQLNELLNQASLREINLGDGERVIDVGCGLGQLTHAMARAAGPRGYVLGIDQSAEQLARAIGLVQCDGQEARVEFRHGDAMALPLDVAEWGSFDVAHARFVLEHVPDAFTVVSGMVRAVRPGGRIVLQDDDHDVLRLWPEAPALVRLWHAYITVFERNETDPYVGRRLVSLLYRAGAEPVRSTLVFWGACAGMPSFAGVMANLAGLLIGARPHIVPSLLSVAAFDEGIRQLESWSGQPDVALWFAVPWAAGRRPA